MYCTSTVYEFSTIFWNLYCRSRGDIFGTNSSEWLALSLWLMAICHWVDAGPMRAPMSTKFHFISKFLFYSVTYLLTVSQKWVIIKPQNVAKITPAKNMIRTGGQPARTMREKIWERLSQLWDLQWYRLLLITVLILYYYEQIEMEVITNYCI